MQEKQPQKPPAQATARQPQLAPGKKFALFLLVVAVCFGAAFLGSYAANLDRSPSLAQFNSEGADGNKIITEGEQNITAVVEKVSPSVVSIITSSGGSSRFMASQAAGTGMIISSDGYVLTNKHVVKGASSVMVITSDGRTFNNVKVLGSDPLNDVAFLKIAGAKDLPRVTIGDSKTVRPGQSVIAIGNALGQYQNTVTSGIISGLGRPVVAGSGESGSEDPESLTDLLQTDAAINSGNSGGPLLNMQGQVIGINTAVAQDAQSIGFAIPIGATKGMIRQVLETGAVKRAVMGLQYISITPEVKSEHKLSVKQGDLVTAVSGGEIRSGSAAAKAGVRKDDVITKVNEQQVGPGRSISTLIGEFRPGETVRLTILRGGATVTKDLTLQAY